MKSKELSILVVNYNTRDLVLECLASLYAETRDVDFEVIVVDNASHDGSADAIRDKFPQVDLVASAENLGFAAGNNLAAERATGEYLLLLNPDTVILNRAIDKLYRFACARAEAGIVGGRTLNGDRTLNPTSCWARPTPWSVFCRAVGLATLFPRTRLFDPESYGRWQRDSEREVDIVTGCLLMTTRSLWQTLGGFETDYFMYGEEADLCLRARALGYRPRISPEVEIIHYAGGTPQLPADRMVHKLKAKGLLFDRTWSGRWSAFGRRMLHLWIVRRWLAWGALSLMGVQRAKERARTFGEILERRDEWMGSAASGAVPR